MKKTIAALFVLTILIAVNFSCKKKATPAETEPVPVVPPPVVVTDTFKYSNDLQGSKDITFANMTISDIEMMCAFLCENTTTPKFYMPTPASTGTVLGARDSVAEYVKLAFNNTQCVDGKIRNGTIFAAYSSATSGAKYYHDFGFVANITLVNFTTDSWRIESLDTQPLTVINKVSSSTYNPANTNLSWQISGKLKFTNLIDPTRNMTWDGKLIKTLVNTNDPAVFNPNKKNFIQWTKAIVNYTGTALGVTSANIAYTLKTDTMPVKRDFNCSFIPSNSTSVTELHPFITGVTVFNSSNFHPRSINYGPQNPGPCDNKGTVSFKNENHTVDFD